MALTLFALAPLVLLKYQHYKDLLFIGGIVTACVGFLFFWLDDGLLFVSGVFMVVFGIFAAADPVGHWLFARSEAGRIAAFSESVNHETERQEKVRTRLQFEEMMDLLLPPSQKRRMLYTERTLERYDPTPRRRRWNIPAFKLQGDKPLTRTDKILLGVMVVAITPIALWTVICLVLVTWWNIT